MYFDSLADFWSMGGYAVYVWSAFGVSLLCLLGIWAHTLMMRKKIISGIREFEQRRARRKEAKTKERVL